MDKCLFCRIVSGEEPSRKIYKNDHFVAFLTPFPNTDEFTVIATKEHFDSYIFELPEKVYIDLLLFSKEVGKILDNSLGVKRTGMIFEGMGINHAHVKLVPLHGINSKKWEPINSNKPIFYEKYQDFIASHDGPRQNEKKLNLIYNRITKGKQPKPNE